MARVGNQPLIVLSEESQRTSGRDAQSMNIMAGRAVAAAIRTTLGPKGMDKMLVDTSGSVVVTNDGVTILDEMEIEHPVANMVIEVAETQEEEVADGTTTAVVVAGELLKNAEDLLDRDVHATTITQGYRQAADHAQEVLAEAALDVSTDDRELLEQLAQTSMTGKGAEGAKEQLAEIVVDAVLSVYEDGEVKTEFIDIENLVGGSVEDTYLIEGVLFKKNPPHENMPYHLDDANIAIINGALEPSETELDANVKVSDPEQLQEFIAEEEAEVKAMIDHLHEIGADAVFCLKGIDDLAQHHLAEYGMMALRRIDDEDADRLARATGATRVNDVFDVTEEHLGFAGDITRRQIQDKERLFIDEVENPRASTILIRGGTDHVVDEVERALEDAIGVIATVLEDGTVVPGGGAIETAVARSLRDFADGVGGREQLAVEAFADAVEVIPRTLAENAGHDPIDSVVSLRAAHDGGETAAGLEPNTGDVVNMEDDGVLEPLRIKTQAIESATEAAVMILRIDDVISAGDLSESDDDDDDGGAGGMGGMGGGMGGMGGGMGGMGGGMGGMM